MSIRKTTFLITTLTFVGMVIILTLAVRTILISQFALIEAREASHTVEQLHSWIDGKFIQLETINRAVAQSAILNATLESEIGQPAPAGLLDVLENFQRFDVFVVVGHAGETIYAQKFFTENDNRPFTDADVRAIRDSFDASVVLREKEHVHTFTMLGDELMLLDVEPVLRGVGRDAAGILVAGYLISAHDLTVLDALVGGSITLHPSSAGEVANDVHIARVKLSTETPAFYAPLNEEAYGEYFFMEDARQIQSVVFRISTPRATHQAGNRMLRLFSLAIYLMALTFGIMMLVLQEWLVVKPITRLTSYVNRIGRERKLSQRLTVKGKDELSVLGHQINGMLDNLEESQASLKGTMQQLTEKVHEQQILQDVAQILIEKFNSPEALRSVCKNLVEAFHFDFAGVVKTSEPMSISPVEAEADASQRSDVNVYPARLLDLDHAQLVAAEGRDTRLSNTEEGRDHLRVIPLADQEGNHHYLVLSADDASLFKEAYMARLAPLVSFTQIAIQNNLLFEQVLSSRHRAQVLSKRLLELQENERREIARELHDEIGQSLTGLSVQMELVRQSGGEEADRRLTDSQALVNELIGQIRDMSLDLRPAMLDDFGLLPALTWYLKRYTQRTNIAVELVEAGVEGKRFSQQVETTAYRVIQEALTNITRHAGVRACSLSVSLKDNLLQIDIQDQGAGFDVEKAMKSASSSGLAGMRERVNMAGGILRIESVLERGTHISVDLPTAGFLDRRKSDR